jgi:hypothetical protein
LDAPFGIFISGGGLIFFKMFLSGTLGALALAGSAVASDLTALGGLDFGSGGGPNQLHSPSPVIGAEYTVNIAPSLKIGGFYDHTFLSYVDGGTGAIHFMGAVFRATLVKNGFVDLKLGFTKLVSNEAALNPVSTNVAIGAEIGAGYEFKMTEHLGITPRVGVRFLPDPSTQSSALKATPETSVMLALHF